MKVEPGNINELAKEIHAENVARGWWDDPDRCVYTCLQLVNTEIAEATEADRKGSHDAHLPYRLGSEVELADTLIRILDLAGRFGWVYNPKIPTTVGFFGLRSLPVLHLELTRLVCELATAVYLKLNITSAYSNFVNGVFLVAASQRYDLTAAVTKKREFNKLRADHNRDVRAAQGGKKY